MPELIAVVGPPTFVITALQRAWDAGDAIAPLDPRLPAPALDAALQAVGAGLLITPEGTKPVPFGDAAPPLEDGDALVMSTSGSTGRPKGVVVTHDAIAAAAAATNAGLGIDPERHRWLSCLPLAHVGGLGVVTRAELSGTGLIVHDTFDPAAASASGATHVALVATALGRIEDPAVFETILLGGAAAPADRPSNSVLTYGMTESYGGVIYDGRCLDGVEARSVDGELQLRSATLLRCYRDGTDPKLPDGWFPTGDLGAVDEDGHVSVAGRGSDLIISGGENVWPHAVEAVVATHPAVAEVAIIGRPDPEWGQRVTAIVVPQKGTGPATLKQLRNHAADELPPWALPAALELVQTLPKTALGKIRRSALG